MKICSSLCLPPSSALEPWATGTISIDLMRSIEAEFFAFLLLLLLSKLCFPLPKCIVRWFLQSTWITTLPL